MSACCFARSRFIFSPFLSSLVSSPCMSKRATRRRRRYRLLYLFTPCTCPGWMARARCITRRVASCGDNAWRSRYYMIAPVECTGEYLPLRETPPFSRTLLRCLVAKNSRIARLSLILKVLWQSYRSSLFNDVGSEKTRAKNSCDTKYV